MIFFCVTVDTIPPLSGLTYFLTKSQRDEGSPSIVEVYLQQCPECEHILQPLRWGKERRTHDVVSSMCFTCLHMCILGTRSIHPWYGPHTSYASKIIPRSGIISRILGLLETNMYCLTILQQFSLPFQLLLCFQCLEQVLLFTASTDGHQCINSSAGSKLVQSILRNHMRPVYSSLVTTAPMMLIAACLKLLTAMVTQGPRSAREVQQTFNFGYKPLEFLPHKSHHIQVRALLITSLDCVATVSVFQC